MLFKTIRKLLLTLSKLFFSYSAVQTNTTTFFWLKYLVTTLLFALVLIGFF